MTATLTILGRLPHPYASSFPGEVLRCRLADGNEQLVLCKREAGRRFPRFGHRGGPGYEAFVYREVVQRTGLPAPEFHGAWEEPDTGDTSLLVEYLENGKRLTETPDPVESLRAAARWAGRLHAITSGWIRDATAPELKVYDAAYYAGWARRTATLAGARHARYPWLATLCARAEEALRELPALADAVIHGEFTPHNVLFRDDEVLPVDWETAAIAVGEIDLATLTELWPAPVVAACESDYAAARWPGGAPDDFARVFALARMYWSLRWLGDRREWLAQPRMAKRYDALLADAEQLGLV